MSNLTQHLPRLLPLAASLGLAFGITTHTQSASAATLLVTDCSDGPGSGTLRNTISSASSGDTVLIQAGTCSTITISGSNSIGIIQTSLTIQGPGSGQLTISGGFDAPTKVYHRAFIHVGSGTLALQGMTLNESKYTGTGFPIGGCIYSAGSVSLNDVTISSCFLEPGSGVTADTRGGAIYAKGQVTAINSTISGNVLTASGSTAGHGAGVYAKNGFVGKYATISNNNALVTNGSGGGVYLKGGTLTLIEANVTGNSAPRGGGLFTANGASGGTGALISYSTIANNTASINGGFELRGIDNTHTVKIVNSTISGNKATSTFQGGGGTYLPTKVYNSTIAFNRAQVSSYAVGLYSSQAITMQSSIFANNTGGGVYDVGSKATMTLVGSNNLITGTTNSVPLGTLSSCPKLGPLANNSGSPRQTHQLLAGSPAIDQGNLTGGSLTTDERGATRSVGGGVDIGAYERQASETAATDDRVFLSEFESACD